MSIIYNVTIKPTKKENRFLITWYNVNDNTNDFFEISAADIVASDIRTLCRQPRHQMDIGQKLFRFLDGDARHLQRALAEAHQAGELLQLHLSACNQVADWPFELLAQEGSFLLPQQVHLVRRVSDWGAQKEMLPQNRQLKMLFMACSALDIKPELEFEREEEAIFQVTEKLAIDMTVEDGGSLEGLNEKLTTGAYDVVHLSGHADIDESGSPYMIMENQTGNGIMVFPDDLWNRALIKNPPRLLFLSGCRTGEAPDNEAAASFAQMMAEKHHVPAVLGWGRSVGEEQALCAEKMLYHELSRGKSILEAVQQARDGLTKEFKTAVNPAWHLLRLFSNGLLLNAIVTEGQQRKPKTREMLHVYLKESRVRVLKEGFVGRRRQLQRSLYALTQDADKAGVLLLGAGGLGKSCLAGKICERLTNYNLVIVHGRLSAITLEAALADAFIIAQDEQGQQILSQKMAMTDKLPKLCATCFKEKNYLLILDDFEQNLEDADRGQPGPLLPEAAELLKVLLHYLRFSVKMTQLIITCRYEFTLTQNKRELVEEKLEKVWLTGFQEAERLKKVRELKNIFNYEDRSMLPALLAAGHGNPYLMEWLDQLVGQTAGGEVRQLADAIKDKQEDFIREHVIRELLQRGGQELELFLHRLSIFRLPVQKEGARAMAEKAGIEKWENLIEKGKGLGLIEHDQARQTYQLTPLLREEFLSKLEDIMPCHEAAFQYYKKICEAKEFFDPILVEEWVFHALGCGQEETASEQVGHLVKYLREILAFRESRRVGQWLLENKKKEPANEYDAFLLNETATTLKNLGEYQMAVNYFDKALALHRAIYGECHYTIVKDLSNLGSIWGVLAGPDKAIEYYEKGLQISERKDFEDKHPQIVGNLLNNLGTAWNGKGDYGKAIGYYNKALATWKIGDDKDHPVLAVTLNNLGSAYQNSGKFQEAAAYFKQALTIDRTVCGELHPDMAADLNNLGAVSLDLGDHHQAIAYYEEAITILWNVYKRPHAMIAVTLSNIGKAYLEMKQLENAKKYYEKAYQIFAEILGTENDYTKIIDSQLNAIDRMLDSEKNL